jgi:hypothetical protein
MPDQTKGIIKKIHQKRKMSEAKQGLTKEASIKTKNHSKKKVKEVKNG